MSEKIYREFIIRGKPEWLAMLDYAKTAVKASKTAQGPLIRVSIGNYDKTRSKAQNAFYWADILASISSQVLVDGHKFSRDTWHEYYSAKFLGKTEIRLMPDLSYKTIRQTSSSLSTSEFADFCEKVMADAATEFCVVFAAKFDESL